MTQEPDITRPVALVTGGSRGLGLALVRALHDRGWGVVVDARDPDALALAIRDLGPDVHPVPGDVADPDHRDALVRAVDGLGRLDLLVHNASTLGASPMPRVDALEPVVLRHALEVNVVAPAVLTRALLPHLRATRGHLLALSSDAAVEAYETWGAYGSSKAALDQLVRIVAVEEPTLAVHAVDPGDMRTQMHADAFPGEDVSDRPAPETVVPAILRVLDERPPSGRLRAADLAAASR